MFIKLNPVDDNPPPHDDPTDDLRELVPLVAGGPGQAPGLCPPGKPSKSGLSLTSLLPNTNLNLSNFFLLPDKVLLELPVLLVLVLDDVSELLLDKELAWFAELAKYADFLSWFKSWLELVSESCLLFIISILEVILADVEEDDEPPGAEDTESGVSGTPFMKRWAVWPFWLTNGTRGWRRRRSLFGQSDNIADLAVFASIAGSNKSPRSTMFPL
jgi:hypothetical protein